MKITFSGDINNIEPRWDRIGFPNLARRTSELSQGILVPKYHVKMGADRLVPVGRRHSQLFLSQGSKVLRLLSSAVDRVIAKSQDSYCPINKQEIKPKNRV